jgi:copper chaperone CopZ
VTVDLAKGITDVTFDDDDVDVHAIVAEIEKSGYGVEGDV